MVESVLKLDHAGAVIEAQVFGQLQVGDSQRQPGRRRALLHYLQCLRWW